MRKPRRTSHREPIQGQQVLRAIVDACEEAKGKDLAVLDVSEVFGLADYFVIVSGKSDRQVQGVSNKIQEHLGRYRVYPASVEGYDKAHWVLMDYGDIVVHVFYESAREYYDLESLWMKTRKVDTSSLAPIKPNLQAA